MKLDYRVYRKAAYLIRLDQYDTSKVCFIHEGILFDNPDLGEYYLDQFREFLLIPKGYFGFWFDEKDFYERQLQRTLALLFMAEYVRTDL